MPHIRPDCAEQSATNFLIEHRRKPNSLAARLTRDVLLLRRAGSSRRAVATALNLSQRRVQTILDGAALAIKSECRPFHVRERDADYASVEAALRAGSTLRSEHLNYSTRCPAPYTYSYFWRRFEDWLDAQPNSGCGQRAWGISGANSGLPRGGMTSAPTSPLAMTTGNSLGFPGLPGRRRRRGRPKSRCRLSLQDDRQAPPAIRNSLFPCERHPQDRGQSRRVLGRLAARRRLVVHLGTGHGPANSEGCALRSIPRRRRAHLPARPTSRPLHHHRLGRRKRDHRGHALRDRRGDHNFRHAPRRGGARGPDRRAHRRRQRPRP